jgi:phage tail-like protein
MPLGIRLDPTPSFKYGVLISGVLMAGFSSCTGLEVSRETKEVVEGGINDHVHVLPGPMKHTRLTLKRGIIFTSFMWEWLHVGMYDLSVMRLPIVITLYSVDGIPTRVWAVSDAFPVKWSAGDLKSDSNEVAVETVEFAHNGLLFIPGGIPVPA